MPKRKAGGRIFVSCWRCKWKGGSYDTLEDANRAIARHVNEAKHAQAVEAIQRRQTA